MPYDKVRRLHRQSAAAGGAKAKEADMMIQENWALPTPRVEEYLQGLDEALPISKGWYQIGGCELSLLPLAESKVGSYSFPRTLVTFSGEEEAVTRFHRQFMIRFLTLGG